MATDEKLTDIATTMTSLGRAARRAATDLATTTGEQRNSALAAAAAALRKNAATIIEANARDMEAARGKDLSAALLDRLMLDADRVEAMAAGLETIIGLRDPVGRVLEEWERPNGLRIQRVAVPLGVIGIIYESRPNVTAGRGRPVHQVRQRRNTSWRLGEFLFEPCYLRLFTLGARGCWPGRRGRADGADNGQGSGGIPALVDGRVGRCRGAARWQEPDTACAGGGASSCDRTP